MNEGIVYGSSNDFCFLLQQLELLLRSYTCFTTLFSEQKTVDISRIRTRIVGLEGDFKTTTEYRNFTCFCHWNNLIAFKVPESMLLNIFLRQAQEGLTPNRSRTYLIWVCSRVDSTTRSLTRQIQCDKIWRNFENLFRCYLMFGKIMTLLGKLFMFWAYFHCYKRPNI